MVALDLFQLSLNHLITFIRNLKGKRFATDDLEEYVYRYLLAIDITKLAVEKCFKPIQKK
ncbi:hypothetical protein ACN92M_25315 (plasmid) [Paenibacillus polymyxa]|uniref:hypothetical protein n=1 Tax=Paenibacillus polymyxa TaxID=1406 RepID=UPI000F9D276F|nr:hypothetical protein EG487_08265 [Paenibacillus polymyxa]